MLDSQSPAPDLAPFFAALTKAGYRGEIADDAASRSVFATDNSIYEVPPQAILFPRVPDDLNVIAAASATYGVPIVPRGGGTGTNGQSLNTGVVVDCSRHLTGIEHIDPKAGIAIVQPGVILDQLNHAAAEFDLFFAPTVSTASRATLGGMAATDASGKGSRVYGRTSNHVLAMDVVLSDGSEICARPDRTDALPEVIQTVLTDIRQHEQDEIIRVFPKMNRGLTGYNLLDLCRGDQPNLIKLLCGSEGTLALTKRLTLKLLPRPSHRALVVVAYDSMNAALGDVNRLVAADPTAIEFIDDKILSLAQQDPIWSVIEPVLQSSGERAVLGLNFVELAAQSAPALSAGLAAFQELDQDRPASVISQRIVHDPVQIAEIWGLRAKCVGLLGRMDPSRQGTPFVEDAAVPAQNLPAFVADFAAALDRRGLAYGMFGHADVGCVHVRPALDMRRKEDAAQIRGLSDEVNALAQSHGGLIWGEHGKGFRGEYGPDVFGTRLYAALCRIKRAFDPANRLNPGKIATPSAEHPLTPLDAVTFRGDLDASISPPHQTHFEKAIKCNGNGQCMGRNFDDAMCPSYKATGDRRRSPKGRAALLRDWARRSANSHTPDERRQLAQFETEIFDVMADCLGCKACASQCPVKVDVPKMRSTFFARYFETRRRPIRHHLLAALEPMGPLLHRMPALSNAGLQLLAPLFDRLGLTALPAIKPAGRMAPQPAAAHTHIVLVEDFFLATFDGQVLDASASLLAHLGFGVTRSGALATGKPAYTIGQGTTFKASGKNTLSELHRLAQTGATLVSVEPAFSSMFQHEYTEIASELPRVIPIENLLADAIYDGNIPPTQLSSPHPFPLFPHCSESASGQQSAAAWSHIFAHFGLAILRQDTGCCGMAGTFGHEKQNADVSARLFDLSWRRKLDASDVPPLLTGFSCRCQTRHLSAHRPEHPVQTLLSLLIAATGHTSP